MTTNTSLNRFINLKLLYEYITLTPEIVGIKFDNLTRGIKFKSKAGRTTSAAPATATTAVTMTAKAAKAIKKINDFKNQCTFIIIAGTPINIKLFNNGNIVYTGCKSIEHAVAATNILLNAIWKLDGLLTYPIVDILSHLTLNHRKEIVKVKNIICYIGEKLHIDVKMPDTDGKSVREAYRTYTEYFTAQTVEEKRNLSLVLNTINIVKIYYGEITEITDDIGMFIDTIIKYISPDKCIIEGVFPAYIGLEKRLTLDSKDIMIANIVKRANCNFQFDRKAAITLFDLYPAIINYDLDEDRYAGLKISYLPPDQATESLIIIFGSGKINIPKSQSHEQAEAAYNFIVEFCNVHFKTVFLQSEYLSQEREKIKAMPATVKLKYNNEPLMLLKRQAILSHPHNIRVLKNIGLYSNYVNLGETNDTPALLAASS